MLMVNNVANSSGTTTIPVVTDLLDLDHVENVFRDSEAQGYAAVYSFFTPGANKAPIKKADLHRFVASSSVIGEMKCVERLMSFLENSEIMDGFDPNHDFVQALYGELCMYLLKLDKVLLLKYQMKSSIHKKDIEIRSQDYLNRFFHRREKINQLQDLIKKEESN